MYQMPIALQDNRILERYEWERLLASDIRHITLNPEDLGERYRAGSPLFRMLIPFGQTIEEYLTRKGGKIPSTNPLYEAWVKEHIVKILIRSTRIFVESIYVDCAIYCMHMPESRLISPDIKDLEQFRYIQLATQAYFHPPGKPGRKGKHEPKGANAHSETQTTVV